MAARTIPSRQVVLFLLAFSHLLIAIGRAQNTSSTTEAALSVLHKNCLSCHGVAQMSGLDIREREGALKGGKRGPAIMPGHPDESPLYLAAAHKGELIMPPGSKAPLPAEDLEILKKWITDGAAWPAAAAVRT